MLSFVERIFFKFTKAFKFWSLGFFPPLSHILSPIILRTKDGVQNRYEHYDAKTPKKQKRTDQNRLVRCVHVDNMKILLLFVFLNGSWKYLRYFRFVKISRNNFFFFIRLDFKKKKKYRALLDRVNYCFCIE